MDCEVSVMVNGVDCIVVVEEDDMICDDGDDIINVLC